MTGRKPSFRTAAPPAGAAAAGFTLVEILAALMILMVGAVSLLSVMAAGASTQRRADLKHRASELVTLVERDILDQAAAAEGGRLVLRDVSGVPLPGRPGLRYSATFVENPDLDGEYLAVLEISWLEGGEERGETFHRILHAGEPLGRWLRRRRDQEAPHDGGN